MDLTPGEWDLPTLDEEEVEHALPRPVPQLMRRTSVRVRACEGLEARPVNPNQERPESPPDDLGLQPYATNPCACAS